MKVLDLYDSDRQNRIVKKIILTEAQKNKLEALHRSEYDRRICNRIKAVPLASEGWSISKISQALRIHETSVKRYVDDYKNKEKLKAENGGSTGYLSQSEFETLIAYLDENTFAFTHQISLIS